MGISNAVPSLLESISGSGWGGADVGNDWGRRLQCSAGRGVPGVGKKRTRRRVDIHECMADCGGFLEPYVVPPAAVSNPSAVAYRNVSLGTAVLLSTTTIVVRGYKMCTTH